MQYSLLFLCFYASLKTTEVVGFGGRADGYTQESIGGLVIDPQDQADRERINAEMDANAVTHGETGLLLTHFKSEDGNMVLNLSCNKSELSFPRAEHPRQVECNLAYDAKVPIALSFEIDYPPVAYLAPAFWLHLQPTGSSGPSTIGLNLTIKGIRMGVAYLRIWAREAIKQSGAGDFVWNTWSKSEPALMEAYLSSLVNRSEYKYGDSVMGLPVKILRPRFLIDQIFRAVISCLIVGVTFAMGCELDPRLIWRHFKKPVGPIIGFCCQFGTMPLIALGVATVVPVKPEFGFGLLTVGCCPGGGVSNVWTFLLHGDLNLSMTMTFISSVAALGMLPLLLFIYGRFFIDVQQIKIPYDQIVLQLLYVVIPVIAGMLVKHFLPKAAEIIHRAISPLATLLIIVIVGFGTYVNLPIYALIGHYPLLLPTAAALPWIGFLLAGLIAFLLRRPWAEVLTIAIETGIQNIGIAILVLIFSMPQPEGDIGAVMPLVVSIFTPLPLMIALIVVCIREGRCVCCRKRPDRTSLAKKAESSDAGAEADESRSMLTAVVRS